MSVDLYPFQESAVKQALTTNRPGILLNHDGGLGKTISSLAISTDPRFTRRLIVAPAKVLAQFAGEARSKFGLEVQVLAGRKPLPEILGSTVLVNYAIFKYHRESLEKWAKGHKVCMILDESHMLSKWASFWEFVYNPATNEETPKLNKEYRGGAVLSMRKKCSFVVLLSATPAPTTRKQVYAQFRILEGRKGVLGAWLDFQERFCDRHMDENGYPNSDGVSNSAEFRRRVAPFVHRAERADWAHLLPSVSRRVEYIPLSGQTKRGAIGYMKQAMKSFKLGGSGRQAKMQAEIALGAFKKQKHFKEFLSLVKESQMQVLVFVNRKSLVEMYATIAESAGVETFKVSGDYSAKAVEDTLARSRLVKGAQVVVATFQRAGESLNLQHLNAIYMASNPGSAGVAIQAEARIIRLGSSNDEADIYYPVLEASWEEFVHTRLIRRLEGEVDSFGSSAAQDIIDSDDEDEDDFMEALLALDG